MLERSEIGRRERERERAGVAAGIEMIPEEKL